MAVIYFAARDAEKPSNDENAGMAHVSIAKSEDFEEVKAALLDYMNGEVVWLAKYLNDKSDDGWCRRRIAAIQNAVIRVAQWTDNVFGFDPGSWEEESVITEGLVWRMVRTERNVN